MLARYLIIGLTDVRQILCLVLRYNSFIRPIIAFILLMSALTFLCCFVYEVSIYVTYFFHSIGLLSIVYALIGLSSLSVCRWCSFCIVQVVALIDMVFFPSRTFSMSHYNNTFYVLELCLLSSLLLGLSSSVFPLYHEKFQFTKWFCA